MSVPRVGMKGHLGEFAEDTVDEYLLQLRPVSWQPDAILRTGSDNARCWHSEVGSRARREAAGKGGFP